MSQTFVSRRFLRSGYRSVVWIGGAGAKFTRVYAVSLIEIKDIHASLPGSATVLKL